MYWCKSCSVWCVLGLYLVVFHLELLAALNMRESLFCQGRLSYCCDRVTGALQPGAAALKDLTTNVAES